MCAVRMSAEPKFCPFKTFFRNLVDFNIYKYTFVRVWLIEIDIGAVLIENSSTDRNKHLKFNSLIIV